MKTSELIGPALDWAVAKCEGKEKNWGKSSMIPYDYFMGHTYSTDWSQGGPIIERERISVTWLGGPKTLWVAAYIPEGLTDADWDWRFNRTGSTPLVTAMRCYVASKLGDEVTIPKELES